MRGNEGFVIRILSRNAYLGLNDAFVSKIRSAVIYHDEMYAQSEINRLLHLRRFDPAWKEMEDVAEDNLVIEPTLVLQHSVKREYDKLDEEFVRKFWAIMQSMPEMRHKKGQSFFPRQTFVRRTLHRWFSGKSLTLVTSTLIPNQFDVPMKRYVDINTINYGFGDSPNLQVFVTAIGSNDFFNGIRLTLPDLVKLEFIEMSNEQMEWIRDLFRDDRLPRVFEVSYMGSEGVEITHVLAVDREDAKMKFVDQGGQKEKFIIANEDERPTDM